jgi:hypothetical protein
MREKLVDDLRTLRDEARVRLHLAAMDVRDAWESLRPLVNEVERDLAGARAEAMGRAEKVLDRARKLIHPPVDSCL